MTSYSTVHTSIKFQAGWPRHAAVACLALGRGAAHDNWSTRGPRCFVISQGLFRTCVCYFFEETFEDMSVSGLAQIRQLLPWKPMFEEFQGCVQPDPFHLFHTYGYAFSDEIQTRSSSRLRRAMYLGNLTFGMICLVSMGSSFLWSLELMLSPNFIGGVCEVPELSPLSLEVWPTTCLQTAGGRRARHSLLPCRSRDRWHYDSGTTLRRIAHGVAAGWGEYRRVLVSC